MTLLDDRPVMRLTAVLLVAGLFLVVIGMVGVASSPLVVVGLLLFAGLAYLVVERLAADALAGMDPHEYRQSVWVAPLLAALLALVWLDASPGELQTLGGITGLVGMANYFLRPVYYLVEDVVSA